MAVLGILIGLIAAAIGIVVGLMGGLLGIGFGLMGHALGLVFHHFPLVLIVIGFAWIVMRSNRGNTPAATVYRGDAAPPQLSRRPQ